MGAVAFAALAAVVVAVVVVAAAAVAAAAVVAAVVVAAAVRRLASDASASDGTSTHLAWASHEHRMGMAWAWRGHGVGAERAWGAPPGREGYVCAVEQGAWGGGQCGAGHALLALPRGVDLLVPAAQHRARRVARLAAGLLRRRLRLRLRLRCHRYRPLRRCLLLLLHLLHLLHLLRSILRSLLPVLVRPRLLSHLPFVHHLLVLGGRRQSQAEPPRTAVRLACCRHRCRLAASKTAARRCRGVVFLVAIHQLVVRFCRA